MYVEIFLNQIKHILYALEESEKRLRKEYGRFEEVMLCLKSDVNYQILKEIKEQRELFQFEIEKIKVLRISLEKIYTIYNSCEEKIQEYEEIKVVKSQYICRKVDLKNTKTLLEQLELYFYEN